VPGGRFRQIERNSFRFSMGLDIGMERLSWPELVPRLMKTSTIVLIVVGVIGISCCSGIALLGKKAYSGYTENSSDSTAFADKELPLILRGWNIQELVANESPELKNSAPPEILKSWFDLFKKDLGEFKSAAPSKMTGVFAYAGTGDSYTRAVVTSDATFEKGNGVVVLTLYKRKDKWQIAGLKINSPALKELAPSKP
jgi:hypothetical protein